MYMEYKLDVEQSDSDINEVRGGLIKHNTPFLEGISNSQVGIGALRDEKKSWWHWPWNFGVIGRLLNSFGLMIQCGVNKW